MNGFAGFLASSNNTANAEGHGFRRRTVGAIAHCGSDSDGNWTEGFFGSGSIRRKWAEHLSGQRNWQYLLWNVLMFQARLGFTGKS